MTKLRGVIADLRRKWLHIRSGGMLGPYDFAQAIEALEKLDVTACEVCPPERLCPGPTCAPDDPHWDGTDGAHPAWWRGNDAGFAAAWRDLAKILADPSTYLRAAAVSDLPWAEARRTVATMAINVGCMRETVAEWEETTTALRKELAEAKRALALFAERERREGRT